MSGPLRHYALRELTCMFAGINLAEGAGDDEFITIEEPEDHFSVTQGADGTVTRSDMASSLLNVNVTLMATSPVNDKLSAIHELDRLTSGGAGVGPFMYANRLGTDTVVAPEAFIMKRPDRNRAKAVGTVTWPFQLVNPKNFNGS